MDAHRPSDPDLAWLSTLSVLYVEDDATTRQLYGHFLARRVGRVLEARDGSAALALFRAERPSLVITDIEMPVMGGLELAEELRRLDADVPIIVTTAFEEVAYLRRSIEAGVDKWVTKPVDTRKLEAALTSCARRLRGEALLAAEHERELEDLRVHEREALGLFAAGMAHDFNNLLQTTLSGLELAVPTLDPGSELAELLGPALAATRQARDLGQSLLTLSESRVARMRVSALEPTLWSAVDAALGGARTTLELDLAPALPPVRYDPHLLAQAFGYLVQNAREAMGDAGTLRVTAVEKVLGANEVPQLAPGRYVLVRFEDTGPGVPPELLGKIFDPYFSTKPRGTARGVGLGLSLCRAIMRRHDGHVTASAQAGRGAVLSVLLPAAAAPTTP